MCFQVNPGGNVVFSQVDIIITPILYHLQLLHECRDILFRGKSYPRNQCRKEGPFYLCQGRGWWRGEQRRIRFSQERRQPRGRR